MPVPAWIPADVYTSWLESSAGLDARYLYDAFQTHCEAYKICGIENISSPSPNRRPKIGDNGACEVEDHMERPAVLAGMTLPSPFMGPSASGLLGKGFRLRYRTMFLETISENEQRLDGCTPM